MTGRLLTIKPAFKVYSSLPAIYSFVPSIGSTSQYVFSVFFFFKSTVSSEIIGMLGVNCIILSQIISLTLKSPFVTGEPSSLVLIFRPFFQF